MPGTPTAITPATISPTRLMGFSAVMLLALLATSAPAATRERLRFDDNWRFFRGDTAVTSSGLAVTDWQWKAAPDSDNTPALTPDVASGTGWSAVSPDQDVFRGQPGFAWFRATLPASRGDFLRLHFESVDDNATVYLNGQRLAAHEGWDEPFDANLGAAWKEGGPNNLVVLVENTDGRGGIPEAVYLQGDTIPDAPDFAKADYDDRSWRTVHLPHDFVVEGTFDPHGDMGHGYLPKGVGWYRKEFTLSASDRNRVVWLEFDGIYRDSRIWLNGQLLGTHPSGYTSFYLPINKLARFGGRNVLAVRADTRRNEGWFYEGGGIYRHVWLTRMAPLHVAHWGTFVTSDVHETKAGKVATITARTSITNEGGAPAAVRVISRIVDPRGREAARLEIAEIAPANQTVESVPSVVIPSPRLWSLETPQLYRLRTEVLEDGRVVDQTDTPFGIRTIRFDKDKGFFLNGKPVKLQGTCNHQDFAGVGSGMPDHVLEWRIRQLKAMGSNAYRCSHNPVAAELLDACDRLGMLVMDENRHLGDTFSPKTPRGAPYSDMSELDSMLPRDRNHPSIILWSMCNEEPLQGSEEGARIFKAMQDETHRLDPTRPVSCAMNGGFGRGISLVEDLQGFNYSIGAYDRYHETHPDQPLYGSETASAVSDRGIYANDRDRGYVSAYDVNHPGWGANAEAAWKPLAERPFMAGGFVWTGFDYRGEPTPYSWPCINSHFGIMDMCGFPKDSYYYYQAWWGNKPVVHLLPHWNWPGKEGQEIDVWCHTNCDRVELFLNRKSLGVKDTPKLGHLEWKVPYAPGRLEAKGYNAGKLAAADVVETTGPPARIILTPDRNSMQADGEDVVLVSVSIVDQRGRLMPVADNEISFSATGAGQVAGVGNGDPSSHEPDRAAKRRAFNGRCMAVVQATNRPGALLISATAPGLRSARVELRTVPSRDR